MDGSSKKNRRITANEKGNEGASLARDEGDGAEQEKGDINLRCRNEKNAVHRCPQDEHSKKKRKEAIVGP